jgi:hypothetical protein
LGSGALKFEVNILADLRKTGQTIGIEDMLIAALALTNQCTFVGWVEHPDIFCWVSFLYPTYLPTIFVLSAKPNKIPYRCKIDIDRWLGLLLSSLALTKKIFQN